MCLHRINHDCGGQVAEVCRSRRTWPIYCCWLPRKLVQRTGRKRTAKEADRRTEGTEETKKNDLDNASGVCARLKDVGGFVVSFLEMKQQ